jgi:hypothetical protein
VQPKTGDEHATLYVGLTSVLDLKRHKDQMRLVGHKSATAGAYGFNTAWTKPMSESELTDHWRGVENYLEAIIPSAAAKYASQEGAVQAAASVFSSHDRIMVDREVALHFKNNPTKQQIFKEVTTPFLSAGLTGERTGRLPPGSCPAGCPPGWP